MWKEKQSRLIDCRATVLGNRKANIWKTVDEEILGRKDKDGHMVVDTKCEGL